LDNRRSNFGATFKITKPIPRQRPSWFTQSVNISATLARPQHLYCYGDGITLFDLAAAYAYGFAKNHCFVSANKRIALASVYVFLRLNGFRLVASKTETFNYMIDLAEGKISQEDLANWLRLNSRPEQAL
jgi:death-on-curing protein